MHYQEYVASVRQPNVGAVVGAVGSPPIGTTSPPASPPSPDQGIEPLDFPHVRPGDLITADFINGLIDVVITIDTRLQRIENLLARLLDRDKTTIVGAQSLLDR